MQIEFRKQTLSYSILSQFLRFDQHFVCCLSSRRVSKNWKLKFNNSPEESLIGMAYDYMTVHRIKGVDIRPNSSQMGVSMNEQS